MTEVSAPAPTLVDKRQRLRAGAWIQAAANGETWLVSRRRGVSLGTLAAAQTAVLDRLGQPAGLAADDVAVLAMEAGGMSGLLAAEGLIGLLRQGGWLATVLSLDDRILLTLHPDGTPLPAELGPVPDAPVLSRFALLRRDEDRLVLESAATGAVAEIADPAVLHHLGVGDASGGLSATAAEAVTGLLFAAGFLVRDATDESAELATAQWSLPERWFHTRSRLGAHDAPYGGTFWAKGRFEPLPARHPAWAGAESVELARPDLDALRRSDVPFTQVLESRRSIRRHHAARPLTADQLGEFLYRTVRVRGTVHDGSEELVDRPVPAGGALHEVEIYPVVTSVSGLTPGIYHYDGHDHRLRTVAPDSPLTRRLVLNATRTALLETPPQVLLVLSARFGRIMWKYQTMAYALALKHVGVLYQTMYTVATAMGLAPCALGGGDIEEFAAATGLDSWAESSVGEFLLGTVDPDAPAELSMNPAAGGGGPVDAR